MTGEARGGRVRLRRAALAAIVVGATTVGLAPAPVDAVSDTCDASSCVQVVVHRAGGVLSTKYIDAGELRGLGDAQGSLQGATFATLGATVSGAAYQRVAVLKSDRSPAELSKSQADDPPQGSRPLVFADADGTFGYSRPASAAGPAEIFRVPGASLRVDLYESGVPLTVTVRSPRNPKAGKPVTLTAVPSSISGPVPDGLTYSWTVNGKAVDNQGAAALTQTYGRPGTRTVSVEVTGADGSFGVSPDSPVDIGQAPETTPTPTPTPTRGTGGRGNGSGTSDRGSSDGRQGSTGSTGSTGSGLGSGFGSTGAPIDPFRVPPSADGLLSTELPFGSASGPQQVAGLVLTGADGRGELADLGSDADDQVATPPPTLGRASPVAIALLVAGILLVLLASAASELTGLSLSPPTRPRRNPP